MSSSVCHPRPLSSSSSPIHPPVPVQDPPRLSPSTISWTWKDTIGLICSLPSKVSSNPLLTCFLLFICILLLKRHCNNVRKEVRKRTGLAWEDSGEIYSDKLKQLRTLRALKPSTLSVVSAITLSIRFGCLPLTDRAPESLLRLSPRVPTPWWLYWVSPRQLLQSDTGVPHFALDPLTYRCLLSLSPAVDFAEPRPPHHSHQFTSPFVSVSPSVTEDWT